jgi:hypothetical protein
MGHDARSLILTTDLAFRYRHTHMKYQGGQESRLGDRIRIGGDSSGVVVCSIDTDEYTPEFPREQWVT